MVKVNKDTLLRVTPWVLSVTALLWCMKQCSSIDEAREENAAVNTKVVKFADDANKDLAQLDSLVQVMEGSFQRVDDKISNLHERVNSTQDLIDSVNARVDSLSALKHCDCGTKKAAPAVKKPRASKTVTKHAVADSVRASVASVARPRVDTVFVVQAPAGQSQNTGVVVNNGTADGTNVVNINNGGTINNYYGVPADTACAKAKAAQAAHVTVTVRRKVAHTATVIVEKVR